MMKDYLELNLYLEDQEVDEGVNLYVHLKDKSLLVFNEVNANPVRLDGVWTISCMWINKKVTAMVLAEDLSHFIVDFKNGT